MKAVILWQVKTLKVHIAFIYQVRLSAIIHKLYLVLLGYRLNLLSKKLWLVIKGLFYKMPHVLYHLGIMQFTPHLYNDYPVHPGGKTMMGKYVLDMGSLYQFRPLLGGIKTPPEIFQWAEVASKNLQANVTSIKHGGYQRQLPAPIDTGKYPIPIISRRSRWVRNLKIG
jgi:hypothetical protein